MTSLVNVRYLTGFDGSSGFILLTNDHSLFCTDFRYQEAAGRLFVPGSAWEVVMEKGDRMRTLRGLLRRLNIRRLGFETTVSYDFFRRLSGTGIRLKPLTDLIEVLRQVKDADEIAAIRTAVARAEEAFLEVQPHIRPGRTELAVARMLGEALKKKGCSRMPFDIIVASGNNGALPHARPTDRRLSAGDLVVIDWGGEAGGYCSDMTRTMLLGGGTDREKKEKIYRLVLAANRKAIAAVQAGATGVLIDRAARDTINKEGYGDYFGHGTGHGVGIEVHELPRISRLGKGQVSEHMVFTIEPGIYVPGLGGVRIEDMVLVKRSRAEVLTTLPRGPEAA